MKKNLKATQTIGEYSKTITIYPFYPQYTANITVNKVREGGKWLPATINWPACGSQSTEYTIHFMMAINVAVFAASLLDKNKDLTGHPDLIS